MSDRVSNYLSGLQTGYRINPIIISPIPDNTIHVIAKFNPYRVALHFTHEALASYGLNIRLPDGQLMRLPIGPIYQIDLSWTQQPHLVYQEFVVFDSINGSIWGFEVVKV